MSFLYFLGCFLTLFGPAFGILYRISHEPLLILLALLAATTWVFVLLIISIFHKFLPIEAGFIILSSILQEILRMVMRIFSCRVVKVNYLKQALAIGFGIATASNLIQLINPLIQTLITVLDYRIFVIGLFGFILNIQLTILVYMNAYAALYCTISHLAFSLVVTMIN